MPSQVVFDIFALPGVQPNYQHSIDAGNAILANNHKAIGVKMSVGKVHKLSSKHKGVGTTKDVTGGDVRPEGWRDARDWRYSQQQKDILGALAPTPGAMPVVWSEGMTQGGRLGEAVNPSVWDETYSGRSGIFMHNGAAAYDAVLLHETLHMVGLHHVATADNVMHATMTGTSDQNKLEASQKQALKDASF